MLRGIYISAGSMVNQQRKLDVVSNNLANVNTTGFKKDLMVEEADRNKSILKVAKDVTPIGDLYFGVRPGEVYTDFVSSSGFTNTDNPMDVAIKGNGFFQVNTPRGIRYTRDGSFTRSNDGYLVTAEGYRVQGQNGDVRLGNGKITFGNRGEIYINGQARGMLRIVDFPDTVALRKEGDNLLISQGGGNLIANPEIEAGVLESSNVNPVTELVDMISLMRDYEANQKVVTTMDSTLDKSVNEVGRV